MALNQSNQSSFHSTSEPTHYSPLEYAAIFTKFHKKCPGGYEILRHNIDLCYTSELSLREYWFRVFNEHLDEYKDQMEPEVRQAYINIRHEAYKKYLGEQDNDEKMR